MRLYEKQVRFFGDELLSDRVGVYLVVKDATG